MPAAISARTTDGFSGESTHPPNANAELAAQLRITTPRTDTKASLRISLPPDIAEPIRCLYLV